MCENVNMLTVCLQLINLLSCFFLHVRYKHLKSTSVALLNSLPSPHCCNVIKILDGLIAQRFVLLFYVYFYIYYITCLFNASHFNFNYYLRCSFNLLTYLGHVQFSI